MCGFILSLSAPVYMLKRHLVRVSQNLVNVIHKHNGVPPYLIGAIQSLYKQKKIIWTKLVIRKLIIRVKDRVAHMPFDLHTDEINKKYLYKYQKLNLKHYLLLKTKQKQPDMKMNCKKWFLNIIMEKLNMIFSAKKDQDIGIYM